MAGMGPWSRGALTRSMMRNLKSSGWTTSRSELVSHNWISFILTNLRGRGEFTLNSWSDEFENAKFGILGLEYPLVYVDVPIIRFFH